MAPTPGPSAVIDRVMNAFTGLTGAPPDGVWSAPGRVNLIGEHTDYNAGLALPIALPRRTYAAARRSDDTRFRLWSAQTQGLTEVDLATVGPGSPTGWTAYAVGVAWALTQADGAAGDRARAVLAGGGGGLDLVIDSTVPLGAGLSSSAALGCAVGAALSDLWGLDLLSSEAGRQELVTATRCAENVVAGAPTGGMDQSASLLCQEGHALLLDCQTGSTRPIPFDLPSHDLALLVVDTKAEHALVDGQYAARRASCERAAGELGVASLRDLDPRSLQIDLAKLSDPIDRARVRHVVTEIERVHESVMALEQDDFVSVGRLFDESHASLRDDYEVSCAELDVAVDAMVSAGALGARMTGGGFGGSCIGLVPVGDLEAAVDAVHTAYADRGWPPAEVFTATAAGPAARDA